MPDLRPFLLALLGACLTMPSPADTAAVQGTVVLEPMEQPPVGAMYRTRTRSPILQPDAPRAVVYLERADGVYPARPPEEPVIVSQHGYQFRPAVVPVPIGGQVGFPNRDDEFHNVFSYSPIKRFDLGRYRKDEESPLVEFDQAGVVRVYCEIHKHMRSLLLVLETPWYTTTDTAGRYRLSGLPAGDYTLHAFLPSERTLSAPVTLQDGATATVDLGEP